MIKVLQFITSLRPNGVENCVINYFKHIDKSKVMFDFCVMHQPEHGYYEDYLISMGSKIYKLQSSIKNYFKFINEVKGVIKSQKYDIVHINCGSAIWYVIAKVAKQCGVKNVVYHSHNSSNETILKSFIHRYCKRKLEKVCDCKLACSDLAGKHMFSQQSYKIICNAIDLNKFRYDDNNRNEILNKYNIDNKILIGHIGRVTCQKNQEFLLKCVPYIAQVRRDFKLIFIGNGDRSVLKSLLDKNELSEYVIFEDNVGAEIEKYYSAFDCFAFPSRYEGLSVVMIEAQANGVPIIASNKLSSEHKIASNVTFLPIDESVECYKAWANAIVSNIGNRHNNTDQLVQAGYSISAEANKLCSLYESMINNE